MLATLQDLYRVPENQKTELVRGEVVPMSPTGAIPGRAGGRIYRSLAEYEEQTGRGFAFPDNVGFSVDLPQRKSFSPDGAFYQAPLPEGGQFVVGAPLLAVEVRSENDYGDLAERDMRAKRNDYFAAGTPIVWDVDVLRSQEICVYCATDLETPIVYRRGDVAEAETAIPGWRFPVDTLFP